MLDADSRPPWSLSLLWFELLPCSTESMDLTKAISWPLLLCDSSSESEKLSYWAL